MTILYLALYALLIPLRVLRGVVLLATVAADKARALANEIRWRVCKLWYTQVKWRLGKG